MRKGRGYFNNFNNLELNTVDCYKSRILLIL